MTVCIHDYLAKLAAELQQGVPPGYRLAELRTEWAEPGPTVRVVAEWEPER